MGSVKDIDILKEPSLDSLGLGKFTFTDNYSVFDWGRMPDKIAGKGKSLCSMGAYNFEILEEKNINTHYKGIIEEEEVKKLENVEEPPEEMAITMSNVPDLPLKRGDYNYEYFHDKAGRNYLIPLEIIFRNFLPKQSSLRDRKEPSEIGLDYNNWPDKRIKLDDPIIEFSTKLEKKDRYLDIKEAKKIAGKADLYKLKKIAKRVNKVITNRAEKVGLIHEDGKIECLYNKGEIIVADVVGTLDENRFKYNGKNVSKEYLRSYYRENHSKWIEEIKKAKRKEEKNEVADWRSLCSSPSPLSKEVRERASNMYKSAADLYIEKNLFDSPSLNEVVSEI